MNTPAQEFILQWNTRSLVSHWGEFREYITNKKPLIAGIQETHFIDSDAQNYTFTLPGYSAYFNNINVTPRQGGAALYISNQLLHYEFKLNTNLNYVAANIQIAQQNINVISIYLSPTLNITKEDFDNFFRQLPSPSLILGDFNAHHLAWGCSSNNTRGRILNTALDDHQLVFLNDPTPTYQRFSIERPEQSVIDLSISSPTIAPFFKPEVQIDTYFSDHFPIHVMIGAPSNLHDTFLSKWNFKKADWNKFQDYIDEKLDNNVDIDINEFTNIILQSAHNNIPHTRNRPGRNHTPWWNNDCKQAVAKRRRALRAFQKCICERHSREAINAKRETKETILKAKREGWEEFSSKFNRYTPLSEIWKLIRYFRLKRKPNYKIPHISIGNAQCTTPSDVANQFAAHYSQVSAHNIYTAQQHATLDNILDTCNFHSDNTEHYNLPFNIKELQLSLSKCGNTSIGPDQLAYAFFQHLSEPSIEIFLSTINLLWEEGTFPESWKDSTLIPIPKPGKNLTDPASYRPISLISCASKIVERMVNSRIRVYLESNNTLSNKQNGFRPGRSTTDGLIHIIDSVQRGFQNNNVTVALFLDLKAAFDKVHHSALLIKLFQIGIRGRLATFLKNFIQNRTFAVRCGTTTSQRAKLDHGVPQGSPLSPTLFLILINDVFENIHTISSSIQFSMYADDLAVWISHPSVDRANHLIQLALNSIQEWCNRWGVFISPAKSATLIFSHERLHVSPHTPLHLNGEIIPQVRSFKYLGLTLDRRLTFNAHIDDLKKRCSRRINILKCITGREWGADRRTLLRLYTSLIRPILDYNAFLLGDISQTLTLKLEAIQNVALRTISGGLSSTPIINLNVDTNIPTLARRREYQLLRYYVRSLSRPETNSYNIMSVPTPPYTYSHGIPLQNN